MGKVSKVVKALSRNRVVLAKAPSGVLYVIQPTGKAEYFDYDEWYSSIYSTHNKISLLGNLQGQGLRFISSWRP